MKQIKVTEVYPPDAFGKVRTLRKYYHIPMPNSNYTFYFKSKKAALQFAAGFSRQLTKAMHEVNYFTADLYRVYRQLWPFIENNNIPQFFKFIDDRFSYLLHPGSLYSIFGQFNTIFHNLDQIISMLLDTALKNKQYNVKYHLQTMQKILDEVADSILNYGQNSRYRIDFDVKKLS